MEELEELTSHYKKFQAQIHSRLQEFRQVWQQSDKVLFSELCFCVCAVQTKSRSSAQAIGALLKEGMLYTGSVEEISRQLHRVVRFHNNKARFIVKNREVMAPNGIFKVKEKICPNNLEETRLWLAKNIVGFGMKEASHFLRNIGFGASFAILDVHVLKNMKRLRLIRKIPTSLSIKRYLKIEKVMKKFSDKIGIPMDALDFVFWSRETGEILK